MNEESQVKVKCHELAKLVLADETVDERTHERDVDQLAREILQAIIDYLDSPVAE